MMNAKQSNTQTEEKGFRLVKYFAYTSFVVLLVFSFPFSVLISQNAKDVLMKSYENYALMLGENLSHQVYQNFVLPVARRFGNISLRQEDQQELLDQVVRNTVHGLNIDLVNIYDMEKGVISYSTDPDMIGTREVPTMGYEKAILGEHSSGLISGGTSVWGLGIEMPGVEKNLRTFIPIRGMNPYTGEKTDVLGVMELTQTLTGEYKSAIRLQYHIFGLSILIMALIFVVLLLIVRKANRIIEQRAKEQLALENQLNQSERLAALGQMIAGVSHEIRNPLGIIRSTAELLSDRGGSDETQKKLSNVIIDASSRLNNIVTEFLDFARPPQPNLQECYLEEIIGRILEFIQTDFEKKGIHARFNKNGHTFRVNADPHLLYTAFLNIFLNAGQSMESGGNVDVNIEEQKDSYLVKIKDTGKGIEKDLLLKIFNPFFSTKDKGSGLGLSIVRNIVESLEGRVWVESEPGSGTRVNVKLPK